VPSPFPGMDPYLEDDALWPSFRRLLCSAIKEALAPLFLGLFRVDFAGEVNIDEPSGAFIEIRDTDGALVTLLAVVGPAEKTTAAGREAYLAAWQRATSAGANAVEIDLVLQGQPLLDYPRDGLPEWDYAVTVWRGTQPARYEIYTTTLWKRLPRFKVPLGPHGRDVVLDLQAMFERCYEEGGFANRINYRRWPVAPASQRRLEEGLTQLGLCWAADSGGPRDEEVARVAYELWEAAGRPEGRDQEHWFQAIERLSRGRA
jgi:hypothetical protein